MRERVGLLLIVLGGLVSIAGGLVYLGVAPVQPVADPGVVLTVVGVVCLSLGGFLLARADGVGRAS